MFTNIELWKVQLKSHVEAVIKSSAKTVDDAAHALLDIIIDKTPIGKPNTWKSGYWPPGYEPGKLKQSWKIVEGSNRISLGGLISRISGAEIPEIDIINDQPYAERIELGWSKQAPYGMMRTSILDYSRLVDSAAVSHVL